MTKMNYNHFASLSFSNSIFLERLSAVDFVRFVEGFEFENISTSITDAVSLPDSIKQPPFPSKSVDSSFD